MVRLELWLLLCSAARSVAYIQYSTVAGYFLQDDNATNATTFNYTATNFGLINQSYATDAADAASLTQWQRFSRVVASLNDKAASNVEYKVLFAGRHGEGWHNAAESFYGTPAWNCYWSLLDGNGTAVWSDAHLTERGVAQALKANAFWKSRLEGEKMPAPESYYTSPLHRCLATANLTFSSLPLAARHPFIPTVKEKLREGISEHTCDRRSDRASLHAVFPRFRFEAAFTEHDVVWTGVTAEPAAAQDLRSKQLLDDIFRSDCATYLSFTSHSGEIAWLLRVLGHRVFSLSTGAVIPVLVRAETIEPAAAASTISAGPWTPSPYCTVPPVTSSSSGGADGGCVCPNSAAPVVTLLPPLPT